MSNAGSNISINPIPLIVDLARQSNGVPDDEYVQVQGIAKPTQGERQRTYTLIGSDGRPCPNLPVVVKERFSNRVGNGVLPPASGYWWNRQLAPVGFIQYHHATSFIPPFGMPTYSLPSIPAQGAVAPLWIKDEYYSCLKFKGIPLTIPGQTVWLSQYHTGPDGGGGPPAAQECLTTNN